MATAKALHQRQRGQTLIESLWGVLILSLIFSVCFRIGFYSVGREFLRFIGRESLVCLLEVDDAVFCQNEAQLRLSKAMGWSRPWIALHGERRKIKVANSSFRPERPAGQIETLRQTLRREEFLR